MLNEGIAVYKCVKCFQADKAAFELSLDGLGSISKNRSILKLLGARPDGGPDSHAALE